MTLSVDSTQHWQGPGAPQSKVNYGRRLDSVSMQSGTPSSLKCPMSSRVQTRITRLHRKCYWWRNSSTTPWCSAEVDWTSCECRLPSSASSWVIYVNSSTVTSFKPESNSAIKHNAHPKSTAWNHLICNVLRCAELVAIWLNGGFVIVFENWQDDCVTTVSCCC